MRDLKISKVFGFVSSFHVMLMAILIAFPLHDDLGKIIFYLFYLAAIFLLSLIFLFRKNKILGLGLLYSLSVPIALFIIVQTLVLLDYRGYF